MLGEKTPAEADPSGEFYTFERGVKRAVPVAARSNHL